MAITYAPLREVMRKRGLPKGYLRETVGLSGMTVAKLSKDEPIEFEVLDRICRVMGLKIEEVICYEDAPFKKGHRGVKKSNVD